MIYNTKKQKFEHEGKTFIIGETIYATESIYRSLVGVIKEIRTDEDMETDNPSPEIICDFYAPVLSIDIDRLKQELGSTYTLDNIIMAPSMLIPTRNIGARKNTCNQTAYLVVEEWNYDGEGFSTDINVFSNKTSALMHLRTVLANEAHHGIISAFQEHNAVVVDEHDYYYEIYVDGDYCNNHFFIHIIDKTIND